MLAPRSRQAIWVFYLLIKYNVLMALTSAQLPFAAPANAALGIILVCGYAASRALLMSVTATVTKVSPVSNTDVGIALMIGLAPSALLGIPGLVGVAAAIIASLAFAVFLKQAQAAVTAEQQSLVQMLAEVSFYLGALASWSYI